MGQKVSPVGLRLGVNKDWESKWYSNKEFAENLDKDIKIRKYIEKNLKNASIASVLIERKKNRTDVTINTAIHLPVNIFSLQDKYPVARDNDVIDLCGIISISNQKVVVYPIIFAREILQI